jgi:NAD(P)-dependent dehydrogenase (short-subunit alcohol dehydrogenase family)
VLGSFTSAFYWLQDIDLAKVSISESHEIAAATMSPCKSILITGCSAGGIGATTALVLAKRGHHIFATARTTSKIPEALSSLDNVTVIPLDVASTSSVAGAVAAVTASGRGLDILINNAGAGYAMPVLDIDIDRAKEAFEVNLWGPLRTIQAFADLLIEGRGRVVNISTCGALAKTPWIGRFLHNTSL